MIMFFNVLAQVIILLILIFVGVVLTKAKVLNEATVKGMTDMVLLIVTPAVIIKSFIREFNSSLMKNLLISFLIVILLHAGYILLGMLLLRDKNRDRQNVFRFGVVFTNCGFMAIPLLESLVGDLGVFYGASFIAIFNILVWSYGINLMNKGEKGLSVKKLILNPGIIGITVALLIFFLNIPIPKVIYEPISFIAALNTPIPMIIIGFHLANSRLLAGLRDLKLIFSIFLRLFAFPLLSLIIMYLCGVRGEVLVSCTICASAPTAAITTMFAAKYEGDTVLSVRMVSLSTILSVISMPIVITLAKYLA